MEVAMEVEDDLFYADLSKRIALLIMDDDDDPVVRCPSVSLQQACRPVGVPSPILYEQTREIKGTGVFIPRSSLPRRKNRQGRSTSFNNPKSYKQNDRSRGPVSSVTYSTNEPSCNFYNSKKY